jgi:hypothetical protein
MLTQDGLEFERKFLNEVGFFISAERGVSGDDVEAAMILRNENKYDLLRLLHLRRVHVVGSVDGEIDKACDLEFEVAE